MNVPLIRLRDGPPRPSRGAAASAGAGAAGAVMAVTAVRTRNQAQPVRDRGVAVASAPAPRPTPAPSPVPDLTPALAPQKPNAQSPPESVTFPKNHVTAMVWCVVLAILAILGSWHVHSRHVGVLKAHVEALEAQLTDAAARADGLAVSLAAVQEAAAASVKHTEG